ncbi:MAG: penicillin acylase family protein, partial [Burkholderiaceae bacterium]|nr:penicillin acylase family protein [Burkholderiaceae bacterium]
MIWLKRVGWLLLIGMALILVFLAVYVSRSHPRLDGELRLAGLSAPVTVQRDGADVTHVLARTPRDAWQALGYVHAQERGWQMEFNRRVMRGQLSEVFGAATLETDKLLRALGIMRAAQAQWDRLPADVRDALQAYSDGVNAFHAGSTQALPPEFHVLGVEPGRWEPQDSVGWSLMMALDLGGNWGNEFARLSAAKVVGTPQLWQLFPPYPGEVPASGVDFSKLYADLGIYRATASTKTSVLSPMEPARQSLAAAAPDAMQAWAEAFVRDAGTLEGKGSNNWAVA